MGRNIKLAAIQMDAAPAPTDKRLERAAVLVKDAVDAGAQVVVLPELFNTGYQYTDNNYALAEPLDGVTPTWMKAQAAEHGIYLVGTLLLLDHEHVYNSALLFAPDGRMWRYDKQYPFVWERAYFRENDKLTIAETELGNIGMMICWDAAHAGLWERYAGKVDLMLIPSCPPQAQEAELVFDDGVRLPSFSRSGHFADEDIHLQADWLNVPVVHSGGSGTFRSGMPLAEISALPYLAAYPQHWGRIMQAPDATLEAVYGRHTKVINQSGQLIGQVQSAGDGFTVAEVELADAIPRPQQPQPKMHTTPDAYFFSDVLSPILLDWVYRRGLRRQWGARMAPMNPIIRMWSRIALVLLVSGWLLGRLSRRGKTATS